MMIRMSFLKSLAAFMPMSILARRTKDTIVSVDRGDKGEVFDANGRKVEKCVEANLTTGRCVVYATNSNEKIISNSRGDAMEIMVDFKYPMRFERKSTQL